MPSNPSKAAAIVAAAEADEIGYLSNPKTDMMLGIEAIHNVCREAGITTKDIEGIANPGGANSYAEYLGIVPKWVDTTAVGGCSFQIHVAHMLAAVNAGMLDIGVVVNGQAGYSRRSFPRGAAGGPGGDALGPDAQFMTPYGVMGAPSQYSHALTRHMHQWGSTKEDFAEIAVSTRKWAMLNPRAVMHSKETNPNGGPISVDDVLNSRIISWPLNILDCCLVTDHGGAVIVASAAAAKSFRTPPVWIAGAGEAIGHATMLEMKDYTATSAAASGGRAYKMAGLGPEDMEMAMIYDSFTVTVGITAEMLGLTKRGEGPSLFAGGAAGPGGSGIPINTNGGGLSFNHSGMYGMQLLVEAYRQLSRTAEDGINGLPGKQVDAETCIVNGTGGSLSATGTLVLTVD
ncbi:MAG: thiolase [Chloroflexi bacterium HGW-Chloroflexi-9]|nr:MAG: thiolase [Chloroflexi bacterium HGW-Chloroflexi-9]